MLKQERVDLSVLDIWDRELAAYGAKIIAYRINFIEKLKKISSRIHCDLTENREKLDLSYESDIPLKELKRENTENFSVKNQAGIAELFFDILQEGRKNDLRRRTTVRGPHRR